MGTVSARRSVRLSLRPMLTTAMLVLAMAMEVTAMVASMATARGLPTPRPMLTTATLVLATAMEATAMAAFTATARGLLTLRLMPTTATLVLATVMEATAMGSVQLMPSPTTDTDTADPATAM